MANVLYDKGRQAFGDGDISWSSDNIRAILIDDADYTVNLVTDEFLSDIPAGARVATSANLTSKANVAGVMDAADTTFTAVTGDEVEVIVLYQHTGTEGTSKLIGYINTGTGLPVTPNGGDIVITWDNGTDKIFKL